MRSALKFGVTNLAVAVLVFGGGTAFAQNKDAVQASVSIDEGQPEPVMTENGKGYTAGNYAVGTIQLEYTHVGMQFPAGPLATFNLNMKVYPVATRTPADSPYPATLDLKDIGSPNVTLSPARSPLLVTHEGWSDSVPVTIGIPDLVAANPDLNGDGSLLVGNFQLDAGGDLKTPTNVQVKIRLVHPTACLKVYNFITDADLTDTITSIEVKVNANKGKVTSTNPYGSLSENLMVVNTCAVAETFDAKLSLNNSFSTQPNNNPGNAVFTFATSGAIDPEEFAIASFGAGTKHGQDLCLQGVSIPAGSTFLATVHMNINNGMAATSLPGGGTQPGEFTGFGASLHTAGAACSGSPHPLATPNPVSAPLAFTVSK